MVKGWDWNSKQSTMWGPVGSRVVTASMSQHVPMSLRARTAADIIIVYSVVSLRCERLHSPFVPTSFVEVFLGEGSVALACT